MDQYEPTEELKREMREGMSLVDGHEVVHAMRVALMCEVSGYNPIDAHRGAAYMLAASSMIAGMSREDFSKMCATYYDAAVSRDQARRAGAR